MKRIVTTALAALTLVGPLATATAYADPPGRHDDRDDRNDRNGRNDRNDNRRWDQSRDNGYMYNGRWNFGPPPANVVGRPGFQAGFHQWRRGDRLPWYYRTHFRVVDYRSAHLRAPPRGCHYVRDDRGNTLLVAIATGVIVSAILSNN
jgi:Ni/Co efflux regulator RcnB